MGSVKDVLGTCEAVCGAVSVIVQVNPRRVSCVVVGPIASPSIAGQLQSYLTIYVDDTVVLYNVTVAPIQSSVDSDCVSVERVVVAKLKVVISEKEKTSESVSTVKQVVPLGQHPRTPSIVTQLYPLKQEPPS